MKFLQTFIEKVRDSANIVDIISQHTELKRSGGGQLKGLCPFPDHNEKTPSFSVSEDKNVYYCFGCGKSGNVFTFLESYRGLNFPEAVEYLADRAGLELEYEENDSPRVKNYSSGHADDKKTLLKLNTLAMEYYRYCYKKLPKDHSYQEYFRKRGLTPELVEKFKLGIASEEWQGLTDVLIKKKAPLGLAEDNGLIKKKNKGNGYFDLFRERLIFPILSPNNETLGFGGRVLGEGMPKYLNSPETLLFNKRKTFYGLHETAKHIRSEDMAVIVEGYMDLLALYAVGICNVVAVLGTALTEEHARKLKRYSKNVVVLFDGDQAGRRAAERSLPILLSQGLYPKRVVLPQGQDPDDFIKENGAEAMRREITRAEEFYLKYVDQLVAEFGTEPVGKVKIVDLISPILYAMEDRRLQGLYFHETVDRLGVSQDWLRQALRDAKTKGVEGSNPPLVEKNPEKMSKTVTGDQKWPLSKAAKGEIELLKVALRSARFWQEVEKSDIFEMLTPEARDSFFWVRDQYRQVPENFDKLPASLASMVDRPGLVICLDEDEAGKEERDLEKIVQDCIKWIRSRNLQAQTKALTFDLKGDSTREQLEQFMNIQKMKRSLKAGERSGKE